MVAVVVKSGYAGRYRGDSPPSSRKTIRSPGSVALVAVQITITVILVSQTPQPDGAIVFGRAKNGVQSRYTRGTREPCQARSFSVWESIMEVDGERERICMRWPERTGACLPLIGTLGKYVGLIGHDMQTFSLEKNVVPELWSVWLCL